MVEAVVAHPSKILSGLNTHPKRRFSQNFLTSPHWAERLVETLCSDASLDEFWEIGPGLGALTSLLVKQQKPVRVFEIDEYYAKYLRTIFPELLVTEGDALETVFAGIPDKRIGVISNLPYHLSSPLFFKLLEHREQFPRLVLTFQKEFAARLVAQPNTKAYGGITVLAQLAYTIESLGVLAPDCFYPRPDVSSQSLSLSAKVRDGVDWKTLNRLTRLGFAHRRKKIIKNLAAAFDETQLVAAFKRLGFSEDMRAEQLLPNDFAQLCLALHA